MDSEQQQQQHPPAKRQRKKKDMNASSSSTKRKASPSDSTVSMPSSVIGVTRSISACQRCRTRKTRCDQKFPSCTSCLKAGVECVGIDAATGREIPRSYVSHLEERVAQLELELKKHGLQNASTKSSSLFPPSSSSSSSSSSSPMTKAPKKDGSAVDSLMSSVKMVSVKAATIPPSSYLGSSAGLSFARLLFTAVKFKAQDNNSAGLSDPSTSKKPPLDPASLPSKKVAETLLSVFFSQANSQLPVLHREQFLVKYFQPVYGTLSSNVSLASDYTTIGVPVCDNSVQEPTFYTNKANSKSLKSTPALYFLNIVFGIANATLHQKSPSYISESFHLAAMKHIDSVLASHNRLEALQGILLLALYSIMRPAVPGVWYILGSATRLCIDLGLHTEGGMKSWYKNSGNGGMSGQQSSGNQGHSLPSHLNLPEYDAATLDMRRRLFWCTYSLDRQVCVYLGRPFGIPEHSIKVPFPSELDDTLIVDSSFGIPPVGIFDYSQEKSTSSSYKTIALSFFKIRKIHAEIQCILYECASLPRQFSSLDEWRDSMAEKLELWHHECPKSTKKMNCNFNLRFLELNYHQTKLLLYGLCPAYTSPPTLECYHIIAESGEKVIQNYHELYNKKAINYTWVVVHNLFMAGTSYLYALYHSPEVRAGTTIEGINFNSRACVQVLTSMIDHCDAAVSCRDTFELLTAAIIKLCYNEQEGVVMQLPNGRHVNKDKLLTNLPSLATLSADKHSTQYIHPHVGNLMDTLPRKEVDYPEDVKPIIESPNFFDTSKNSWGDLDLFFQQAYQMDGVSPKNTSVESDRPLEFQQDVLSNNNSDQQPEQEPEQEQQQQISDTFDSSVPLGENDMYMGNNNVDYQPRVSSNEGQRIYDIINEVPMAAIWDQFFAPLSGTNPSVYDSEAITGLPSTNGISTTFGLNSPPPISSQFMDINGSLFSNMK